MAVAKKGDKPTDGITDLNPEGLTAATGKWAPQVRSAQGGRRRAPRSWRGAGRDSRLVEARPVGVSLGWHGGNRPGASSKRAGHTSWSWDGWRCDAEWSKAGEGRVCGRGGAVAGGGGWGGAIQ